MSENLLHTLTIIKKVPVESTLVIIKPDVAFHPIICPQIIKMMSKYLESGCTGGLNKYLVCPYRITDLVQVDKETFRAHYAEHKDQPWFEDLITFMQSGFCMVLKVTGVDAIAGMRRLMGSIDDVNTVRGKYASTTVKRRNAMHASDSKEAAERELELWFPEGVDQWDIKKQ